MTDFPQTWQFRSPTTRLALGFGWLCLMALFVSCWEVMTANTIWTFLWDAPRQVADLGSRMFPPRLSYLPELLVPLWDTLNMATPTHCWA